MKQKLLIYTRHNGREVHVLSMGLSCQMGNLFFVKDNGMEMIIPLASIVGFDVILEESEESVDKSWITNSIVLWKQNHLSPAKILSWITFVVTGSKCKIPSMDSCRGRLAWLSMGKLRFLSLTGRIGWIARTGKITAICESNLTKQKTSLYS